jgi:hypothetical protein
MPSGSSSRDVSIRTVISFALGMTAAFVVAAPAFARSDLDLGRADLSMAQLLAVARTGADSASAVSPPPPQPPAASPLEPADTHAGSDRAARKHGAANPRKALMLSLLLPGTGELYSGHKGRATGFFISEGAIWANFAAWEIAGHLRQNNYIEQAQLNAGLGTGSGSDDYWRLVGTYTRSSGSGVDSYEDALRRDARNQYPSDPAAQDAYVAQRLPTGSRAWDWTSASALQSYRITRQNATRAFNRAKFSFALAILNRLASAIDTQMLHRGDAKDEQSSIERSELRILTDMTADGGGRLLLRTTF